MQLPMHLSMHVLTQWFGSAYHTLPSLLKPAILSSAEAVSGLLCLISLSMSISHFRLFWGLW